MPEETVVNPSVAGAGPGAPALLKSQRSHRLFVLSEPAEGRATRFLDWYLGEYVQSFVATSGVIASAQYDQDEVDITRGKYARLPFRYLHLIDLSLDGAEQALPIIERIQQLHGREPSARPPATWLYYPASERVGRSPQAELCSLTLAFANGLPGQEAEFREWYATRHIRHALNIPALVGGQCFERTLCQRPGAMPAAFAAIAIYEQVGTAAQIIESFAALPAGTFHFPMLDRTRFAEWVYRPLRHRQSQSQAE